MTDTYDVCEPCVKRRTDYRKGATILPFAHYCQVQIQWNGTPLSLRDCGCECADWKKANTIGYEGHTGPCDYCDIEAEAERRKEETA
jgi:hypothetical protein